MAPTAMGAAQAGHTGRSGRQCRRPRFFDFNQSDLCSEARATLDRQAAWLKKYPPINVTIEGHCDERGTREYNLALGERRATAVKNYLVADGIGAGRVKTSATARNVRPCSAATKPLGRRTAAA